MSDYIKFKNGEITNIEYRNRIAIKQGHKNRAAQLDSFAVKKGYKNHTDYCKNIGHKNGRYTSMDENKDCAQYLGVYIAERLLSNIYDNVTRMPNNNPGFDFICGKGFKIDVKTRCLSKYNNRSFSLRNNIIADYFLFLAMESRESLNPIYIWLRKNDESMHKITQTITNTPEVLKKWEKYEQTDKLEKLIACCDTLRRQ